MPKAHESATMLYGELPLSLNILHLENGDNFKSAIQF